MKTPRIVEIHPGAVHMRGLLTPEQQATATADVVEACSGRAGWYRPRLRSGAPMNLEMTCLGRHWNPKTYGYEDRRSDHDGEPVNEIPAGLADLARLVAQAAGYFSFEPDVCIANRYAAAGRLGIHQDRDESAASIREGKPIVSLSLGDDAVFVLGGTRRNDPLTRVVLRSGDAFVFGGPSRLRFHGITAVHPGTGPKELGIAGRINLTFREGAARRAAA